MYTHRFCRQESRLKKVRLRACPGPCDSFHSSAPFTSFSRRVRANTCAITPLKSPITSVLLSCLRECHHRTIATGDEGGQRTHELQFGKQRHGYVYGIGRDDIRRNE